MKPKPVLITLMLAGSVLICNLSFKASVNSPKKEKESSRPILFISTIF